MRKLWYNGNIVSMDGGMSRYEALGAEGGRIVFLGGTARARAQDWDEATDLNGATMLPGFTDSHMHLLHYATIRRSVNLFGVKDMEGLVGACREWIERRRPLYLMGMGWNQDTMAEGRMVTKDDLDRVSTEIPVCATRACLHIAACNSVMLEQLRLLEGLTAEERAEIDFDTGILRESAVRLYMRVFPAERDETIRDMVLEAQRDLNAAGITCIHSDDLQALPGVEPMHMLDILRGMGKRGELTARIYEQCLVYGEDFPRLLAARSDPADRLSLFRTGPRKLLEDGSIGAGSAEMIGGYVGEPDNHGIANYTPEELYEYIRDANAARMDVAVHAIGDLAFKKVCDTFERVLRDDPWPDHRHGIVHAQITTPALLERMRALGLQAYIQPIFIDADMGIIDGRVGSALAASSYAWRSMARLGIHTSGGSDCPVEPFNVLDNMRSAITRKNRAGTRDYRPDEALSTEEAVRLFTSGGAWAARDEAVRGTLEIGKLADLAVLDRDIFAMDSQSLPAARVVETVLGGETVYRAQAAKIFGKEKTE